MFYNNIYISIIYYLFFYLGDAKEGKKIGEVEGMLGRRRGRKGTERGEVQDLGMSLEGIYLFYLY